MIRLLEIDGGIEDVVPQAIFYRPLTYFTGRIRESHDDLDTFRFATFLIGNMIRFDLRCYAGHPPYTSTLYLALGVDDPLDIGHAIRRAVREFRLPTYAVAWRRGQPFEYGVFNRKPADRLREPEARSLVLKIAALMPDYRATTEDLINRAPEFFQPSPVDLMPSKTRIRQPRWHQIIRNVISHRDSEAGPFRRGFANRTWNGLALTEDGMRYLSAVGYEV